MLATAISFDAWKANTHRQVNTPVARAARASVTEDTVRSDNGSDISSVKSGARSLSRASVFSDASDVGIPDEPSEQSRVRFHPTIIAKPAATIIDQRTAPHASPNSRYHVISTDKMTIEGQGSRQRTVTRPTSHTGPLRLYRLDRASPALAPVYY